jgi:hypothetical protein
MGRAMGAAVGGAMGAAGGATAWAGSRKPRDAGHWSIDRVRNGWRSIAGRCRSGSGFCVGDTSKKNLAKVYRTKTSIFMKTRCDTGIPWSLRTQKKAIRLTKAAEVMNDAGAEDLDTLRENWWQELREGERTHYVTAAGQRL